MALLKRFTFLHLRQVQSLCTQTSKFKAVLIQHEKHKAVFCTIFDTCKVKYKEVLATSDLADHTWEDIRKNLIDIGKITPSLIDSMIIDVCHINAYINAGISYYKFLEKNNYKPSIVTTGKYLKLYDGKQTPIAEKDKAYILNVYNILKGRFPVFDYFTANSCILGLCAIGEWKESIEIIKNFETHEKAFLLQGYSALIHYLIEHGQAEIAYEYLVTCFKQSAGPLSYVYTSYLNYCLKEPQTFNEKIEKLFNLWAQYDIKPHADIVNKCILACNKLGWNGKLTTVTFSTCLTCKQKLSDTDLSQEEFKYFAETIKKKLFVAKGYEITHPAELMKFVDFVEKTRPYDVVVDGLNILLKRNTSTAYYDLKQLLAYFHAANKKVLVIARKHVSKLVNIHNLSATAKFFFVNDISKDDLFILYAALTSGYNTKIVSEDFMRQHKFALHDIELSVLFKRWQISRQYVYNQKMKKPVNLNHLYGVLYGVQKQNNCWHIPFHKSVANAQRIETIDPNQWACLKMSTLSNV